MLCPRCHKEMTVMFEFWEDERRIRNKDVGHQCFDCGYEEIEQIRDRDEKHFKKKRKSKANKFRNFKEVNNNGY